MSTRSSILMAKDGINNVHVYTDVFESNDLIFMETWYRDEDEKTISACITMPRALWEQFQIEIKAKTEECEWVADDDGVYETECGNRWVFDAGTAKENRCNFCPYCGKALKGSERK